MKNNVRRSAVPGEIWIRCRCTVLQSHLLHRVYLVLSTLLFCIQKCWGNAHVSVADALCKGGQGCVASFLEAYNHQRMSTMKKQVFNKHGRRWPMHAMERDSERVMATD